MYVHSHPEGLHCKNSAWKFLRWNKGLALKLMRIRVPALKFLRWIPGLDMLDSCVGYIIMRGGRSIQLFPAWIADSSNFYIELLSWSSYIGFLRWIPALNSYVGFLRWICWIPALESYAGFSLRCLGVSVCVVITPALLLNNKKRLHRRMDNADRRWSWKISAWPARSHF